MSSAPVWAVIGGGGTGGHVVPGLAIADEIVARGAPREAVHYVGSARGLETRLVPRAGFALTALPGRGIQRRLTVDNLAAVAGLLLAIGRAILLIRRLRPAVVVGLGGYASVPAVIGAIVWRVPLVIAEQNAVPSAANRLAGRFAKASAVPFDDTELPRATWTGNPVRAEILAVDRRADRAEARRRLGVADDRVMLTVFGGSLGARRINDAVIDAAARWRDRADLAIRHVAGDRDHDDLVARRPVSAADALAYELVRYEDDMASVYAATDLVLCRAGASSVAELAVVGLPAVLVPLPGAPGDHQTANARRFESAGAAVMIADTDLDGARVVAEVDPLVVDRARRDTMGKAALTLARPDAAAAVVDLVEAHARRPIRPRSTP